MKKKHDDIPQKQLYNYNADSLSSILDADKARVGEANKRCCGCFLPVVGGSCGFCGVSLEGIPHWHRKGFDTVKLCQGCHWHQGTLKVPRQGPATTSDAMKIPAVKRWDDHMFTVPTDGVRYNGFATQEVPLTVVSDPHNLLGELSPSTTPQEGSAE